MSKTLQNGLVVLFEGVDGVGKTTQLERAAAALSADGWVVTPLRNLGGTPIGEALRDIMLAKIPRPATTDLYISAAIQEALVAHVQELRNQGTIILLDRSPISLAAYAIFGGNVDPELGWPHVDHGMSQLAPELTLIYTGDLNTVVARARTTSGSPDYFESKPDDYFERVAQGYETCAERYSGTYINAERSIDAIHEDTMQRIRAVIADHS